MPWFTIVCNVFREIFQIANNPCHRGHEQPEDTGFQLGTAPPAGMRAKAIAGHPGAWIGHLRAILLQPVFNQMVQSFKLLERKARLND